MKLIILCILILVSYSSSELIDCTPKDSYVKLLKYNISPVPIVRNKEVTVTLQFETGRQIDGGKIEIKTFMKVGDNWIPMPNYGMDLCSLTECPVKEGKHDIHRKFKLPSIIPKGEFKGTIQAKRNDRVIMCLNYHLQIE